MSSRFTLSMKMKAAQHRRRQGNESLTAEEIKFMRRKVIMLPNGGFLIESIEHHLERMLMHAALCREFPQDGWQYAARVITSISAPLKFTERRMIEIARKNGRTVAQAQSAIVHYRKATGRYNNLPA